jgi:AbrB family looped-hinge helix DNA binding protein
MARGLTCLSVDRKGRATLPEEVRKELGLQEGDLVLLERTERGTYNRSTRTSTTAKAA